MLCLCPLLLKCGAAESMKAGEVGKRGAQKVRWDLGMVLGVFGIVETSSLTLWVIAPYNPFNECITLHFTPNSASAPCYSRTTSLISPLNVFTATSDPFVLVLVLTLLQQLLLEGMFQFVSSGAGGKLFLSTFLYGEFGNWREALSRWESVLPPQTD